jgi:hypothetical protein
MANLRCDQFRDGDIVGRKARADKRCAIGRFAAVTQSRGVVSNEGGAGAVCVVAAPSPLMRRNE